MYKIGLVSISFRKNTVDEIIEACLKSGISGVEWGSDVHVPQGNTENAKSVFKKTIGAGLSVFAYGSYYRAGENADFKPFLESAQALHAPVIRVWAGTKGNDEADEEYRKAVIADTQKICDMAKPIKIVFEFHGNTLTDNYQSALELYNKINRENFGLYWQPDFKKSHQINLEAIKALLPYMSNIHSFFWKPDFNHRGKISEGEAIWKDFIKETGKGHNFLLEFMPDDDISSLPFEAEALRKCLED